MATAKRPHGDQPCAVEIYVPGLIYIRLERFPRWLLHVALTSAGAGAGAGWLPGIQGCSPYGDLPSPAPHLR
jgi:hypothetical protein